MAADVDTDIRARKGDHRLELGRQARKQRCPNAPAIPSGRPEPAGGTPAPKPGGGAEASGEGCSRRPVVGALAHPGAACPESRRHTLLLSAEGGADLHFSPSADPEIAIFFSSQTAPRPATPVGSSVTSLKMVKTRHGFHIKVSL